MLVNGAKNLVRVVGREFKFGKHNFLQRHGAAMRGGEVCLMCT